MVCSISKQDLRIAIEKVKDYYCPILASKTVGYYMSVWDKLSAYSDAFPEDSNVDIERFYELTTHAPAFNRPETPWLKTQARAILSILDIHEGRMPKREYYYKKRTYNGIFQKELDTYLKYRVSLGKKNETIRSETALLLDFLNAMEEVGIKTLPDITAEDLLDYLHGLNQDYSDQWKRAHAYAIRKFLNCPDLKLVFSYDLDALLLGFRHSKHQRLESYYTVDEIRAVMDAVDRDTKWGKTIYAMMLLACIYGLRVSDIRNLLFESIHWKERTISFYQIKTGRYVELPLIDEVALSILDYLKNVRPVSDDPHVFLRHTRPFAPYSQKDNFGSKVSHYFQKAGVNTDGKHHGLHSMRHSLATNLLGDDTAVNEIAFILGHSSIKSTRPYIWSDIKHLKMCALEVDRYDR